MLREDVQAYKRFRECTECLGKISPLGEPEGNIFTVEMDESDFNKVCSKLDSLREFRQAVQQALDCWG
jgi:glutamate/tyrosine decarboxylase-like PLP-dependent enzyme